MKEHVKIGRIIGKHLLSNSSDEEEKQLQTWLKDTENDNIFQSIHHHNHIEQRLHEYKQIDTKKAYSNFLQRTEQHRFTIGQIAFRAAAIAGLVVTVGIAINYLLNSDYEPDYLTQEVIHPGTSKAILKLANGARLELGTTNDESVINEDGVQIFHTDSSLVYQNEAISDKELLYNTLVTPHGGEYQLELADGTKVWLNAQSELTFPVAFSGTSRTVKLTGEAYFEVAHNPEQPFIVETTTQQTEVLGTAFNLSAYPDETQTVTTLVSGSVEARSTNGNESDFVERLKPNQQLIVNHGNSGTVVVKEVNTYLYSAWKEGRLVFRDQPLEVILDDMKRWYNFDVVYNNEASRNYRFSIDMPKYESINKFISILELTGSVDLEVNGNTLTVKSIN
ncbi:FecR domain-containing protein [Carboxylicivirga sediminis]|uniref:FecR domain-containing protein n=1 Tax=Carboxylicivirga sediminis TaxID=2006564 RepID=A0A941IVW1_9BACT|nr:FecR family protein [Carboxylicivirga sediminis]MBR8533954.1 FecR domain-containing protein [Carboxylicivirga sediminis]